MKLKLLAASILVLCMSLPARAATIRLAWDPSPSRSVVGYRVHYGLKSGKYTHVVQVKGRFATKVAITGLEKGKTYFFAVSAYNAKGQESALSSEISGRPGEKAPKKQNKTAAVSLPASHKPSLARIPPRAVPRGPDGKILPTSR